MTRKNWFVTLGLLALLCAHVEIAVAANIKGAANSNSSANTVSGAPTEFFEAVDNGQLNAKLIVMNDHAARLILTNNTQQPLNLKLPEAFAGVPVAAQFGGAGGGARGGGGRAGGGGNTRTGTGGGGQQQSVGGGGGGGGLGGGGGGLGGGGGGGGGFFSIPPEKSEKVDFPVLCLNHGLREPSSSTAYKIVPADSFLDRPAVVELLKAFGRGELKHNAAQAAAWNLNNDLSWNQLAAKLQGTRRSFRRPPYFTADEIRAGMAYANEASRLAEANADQYKHRKKENSEKPVKLESSDARSTTDSSSYEPAKADDPVQSADAEKPATGEKK